MYVERKVGFMWRDGWVETREKVGFNDNTAMRVRNDGERERVRGFSRNKLFREGLPAIE